VIQPFAKLLWILVTICVKYVQNVSTMVTIQLSSKHSESHEKANENNYDTYTYT